MRGLPDSAVVGTYKRLHRKPRRQAPIVSYDEQAEMISILLGRSKSNRKNAQNNL